MYIFTITQSVKLNVRLIKGNDVTETSVCDMYATVLAGTVLWGWLAWKVGLFFILYSLCQDLINLPDEVRYL